jgi:hypothetical protein
MSKVALKTKLHKQQDGFCAISAKQLAKETKLFDTDRIEPKAKGGTYTDGNSRALTPLAHMERHNILKLRTPELTELKVLIDGREQIRKFMNSLNNRLLAVKRQTDQMDQMTEIWIKEQIKSIDKQIGIQERRIDKFIKKLDIPVVKSMLGLKGLGTMTIAYLLVYIDINKAEYASALWKYVGFDKPSYERYTKGESGGGNKTLRTVLYTWANSGIRTRSIYRIVYDQEKIKLENSMKITKSRNTQGKLIECMWSETKPCHRHGASIRKMIKHFLADLWFVWRTLEGLPTPDLYVEAKMGHIGIVKPNERGWIY